jgi:hypothetical protein
LHIPDEEEFRPRNSFGIRLRPSESYDHIPEARTHITRNEENEFQTYVFWKPPPKDEDYI